MEANFGPLRKKFPGRWKIWKIPTGTDPQTLFFCGLAPKLEKKGFPVQVGGEWGGSAHYPDPTAQSARARVSPTSPHRRAPGSPVGR